MQVAEPDIQVWVEGAKDSTPHDADSFASDG
jgi:hypothetical protein